MKENIGQTINLMLPQTQGENQQFQIFQKYNFQLYGKTQNSYQDMTIANMVWWEYHAPMMF